MFSNFFPENRAVYEIMSKNMVDSDMPQIAVWRRVVCWISKATRAQSHANSRAPTSTPHTHERTRAHTRESTHTHTHRNM